MAVQLANNIGFLSPSNTHIADEDWYLLRHILHSGDYG